MTYTIASFLAALAFTFLAAAARRAGRPAKALGTTALVFWGAALMWSVDMFFAIRGGEPLFEEWKLDAWIAAAAVAAGVALFAVLRVLEGRRAAVPA